MMIGQWVLITYAVLIPFLLFVLLCGDRPAFERTFIERLHHFFFSGGLCDCLLSWTGRLCGERGTKACTFVEEYLCERPNPVLQLFYLLILGGSYLTIASTSLQYIPGVYVSEWHKYAGQLGVFVGCLLFLVTSFSDPGVIDSETLNYHISSYPYDGVIYEGKKECTTCKIVRPARSKHCSICDRCVARFDHHCGWMNNCIGEKNLRYFLLFLLWHICLCWYAAVVLGAIMLGEVEERKIVQAISYYYGVPATLRKTYPQVLQWLFTFYSSQVLMIIFLLVISILLAGFAGYHIYLVLVNTTTNETYKWDVYRRWQAEAAHTKMVERSGKVPKKSADGVQKKKRACFLFNLFTRNDPSFPEPPRVSNVTNVYNGGCLANFAEVLFPLSQRVKSKKL